MTLALGLAACYPLFVSVLFAAGMLAL